MTLKFPRISGLFVLLLAVAAQTAVTARAKETPPNWPAGVEVDRVEGQSLVFKAPEGTSAPKPLVTPLHELKYLATLNGAEGGLPYFLVTAAACVPGPKCPPDRSVYLVRPDGTRPTQFTYPGRILDPKTRELLIEARMFYGKCLNSEKGEIIVSFQKERLDRKRSLQASVFVADPGKDHVHERLLEKGLPRIEHTLKLVKAKTCREIEGRNRLMLAKPLDLNPRRGQQDEDKDDEDDVEKSGDTP